MFDDPKVLFLKAANTSLCRAKEPLGFERTLKLPNNQRDLTSKFKRFFTECVKASSDNVSAINSDISFSNLRFKYSFKKNKKAKLLTPRRLTEEELSAFYSALIVLSPHKFLKIHLSWVLYTQYDQFIAKPENIELRQAISSKVCNTSMSFEELKLTVADVQEFAPEIARTVLERYPFLKISEELIIDAIKMGFANYKYLATTNRSWNVSSEVEEGYFPVVAVRNFQSFNIFNPLNLRAIDNIYSLCTTPDQEALRGEGWNVDRQKIVTFNESNGNNLHISFDTDYRSILIHNYIRACTATFGYKTARSIDKKHIKDVFRSFMIRTDYNNRLRESNVNLILDDALSLRVGLKLYTLCQYTIFRDMLRTFGVIEKDYELFPNEAFLFSDDKTNFTSNDALMNMFSYFFNVGIVGTLPMDFMDILFSDKDSMKLIGVMRDVNFTNHTYVDVDAEIGFNHILNPKTLCNFISNVMKTDNPDFVLPDLSVFDTPTESKQNDSN